MREEKLSIHPFKRYSTILVPVLLLGLALRLLPLGQNRFLEDEALYAYWGLQIATGIDPMLDEEAVDKPPLYLYALALSSLLASPIPACSDVSPAAGGIEGLQAKETTARLPSILASVTGIALIHALGKQLYGDQAVGILAALLLALSPYDILFASTAFTDPLMTALVLAALLAAAKGHLGVAGVMSGLAAATKQQALFFLPLVVALGWLTPTQRHTWRQWVPLLVGLALVAVGVFWWDQARAQRPGFFEQSLISYGGLVPVQVGRLGQRALEWLGLVGYFWSSSWLNGLLLAGLGAWLVGGSVGWWPGWARLDLALGAFVLCFLGLHWLVDFQVWDRYLLGLVPLAALLAARALVTLGRAIRATRWQKAYALGLVVALLGLLWGPVLGAARSEIPVGGDHGAYDGIDRLADYLCTEVPPGSVVYHYWLGYHYRFYLYGAPLRLHWYPDLDDLTRDATVYRREPRYIAFASWRDSAAAEEALAASGMTLSPVFETIRRDGTVSFRLYRLDGP